MVVPCYNHASYLDLTVRCLLHQTYRPFQVIFVEDRSTDDTWPRLQDLAAQFPDDIQVTLLRSDRNRGQSAAINLGVEQTNASVYTILNDDDYLMHDALDVIMSILKSDPSIFLLGSDARVFSDQDYPPDHEASLWIGEIPSTLQG